MTDQSSPSAAHAGSEAAPPVEYTHVLMTWEELLKLPVYSRTLPTGTTIGKVWRRQLNSGHWMRGEYVEHPDAGTVGIKWQHVLLMKPLKKRGPKPKKNL